MIETLQSDSDQQDLEIVGIYVLLGSINSYYFHIIGDGKLNPIIGFYIPIIRIPN